MEGGLRQPIWPSAPDPPLSLSFPLFHTLFLFTLQHRSLAVLWACLRTVTRQQLCSNGYQDNSGRVTLWFHEGLIDWDWRQRRRGGEDGEWGGEGEMFLVGGLWWGRGGFSGKGGGAFWCMWFFSHATRHGVVYNHSDILCLGLECCLRDGCIMRSPFSAGQACSHKHSDHPLNSVCQRYLWHEGMHNKRWNAN